MMDELFAGFEFYHPWWLLCLLLIPFYLYHVYSQKKAKQLSFLFPDFASYSFRKSWKWYLAKLMPLFRSLAIAMIVFALARPRQVLTEETIHAESIDIFLAMDLSSSMLAKDFEPDRLEVSKRIAAEFVDNRKYDRIGLAVFAGESFTQCPLTTDHEILKDFLAQLQCGMLEDGTAIGMGLATAVNRLKSSESRSKIVILLTDGVNNAGYILPETSSAIAKEFGIKVYTIGVGSKGDALSPVRRRRDGSYLFGWASVQIDEALLEQIANETGGKYYRASNEQQLFEVYSEIDKLEKTKIEIERFNRYEERFYLFIRWALILLLLEFLIRKIIIQKFP